MPTEEEFDDVVGEDLCPLDLELQWMAEASSAVYATPLITDLHADGRKDVVVPSYQHYLEVLEGPDGAQALGWPAFHRSTVHASPLLFDADMDGVRDILVTTYDGEVLFFKDTGEQLSVSMTVPRLKVRRNWYQGLRPDPTDHSKMDVGGMEGAGNPFEKAVHGGDGGKSPDSGDHPARKARGAASPTPSPPATPAPPVTAPQAPKQQQQQQRQAAKVEAPTVQAPQVTQPQQAQQPPQVQVQQQQQASPAPALDTAAQSAVLEFRRKLDAYRAQYGQAAAEQLQADFKSRNPALYSILQQQLAQEAELAKIAAGFPGGDGGGAPHGRRLMQADAEDELSDEARDSLRLLDDVWHRGADPADGAADPGAGDAFIEPDDVDLTTRYHYDYVDLEPWQRGGVDAPAADSDASGSIDGAGDDGGGAGGRSWRQEEDEFGDLLTGGGALPTGHPYTGAADGDGAGASGPGSAPKAGDPLDGLGVADPGYDHLFHLWKSDAADAEWASRQAWEEESFEMHEPPKFDSEFVWLDPHVMTSPSLGDIDGDGREELVVAVSYFFDKEYYDEPRHASQVAGLDLSKYAAGGIVVFDLRSQTLKWSVHLDLTTLDAQYVAHIYSRPTLADIDGDGQLEVLVGTSVGFVYVLDSQGNTRPGWPLQMGEVQGQVLVGDLNGDGKADIFAADVLGNIVLWDAQGHELWERHVKSAVPGGATAGDVNGDGILEILFGDRSGRLHAVRGTDGAAIDHFPFKTRGMIEATPMATRLRDGNTLHIAIMSFDGFLYVIDGASGCADTVDIGEASYTMVLADDLTGEGRLQLLASTVNGNVYAFQVGARYHPLRAWPSQVQGVGGLISRDGYFAVTATLASRQPRDVAGDKLLVEVEVHEHRAFIDKGAVSGLHGGPYNVTIMLQGVGVREMNAGPQPVIGVTDSLPKPGKYVLEVPCPRTRATAAVLVDAVDEYGVHYQDEFVVSFHMHFHKLLKWVVALPMLAMGCAVLALAPVGGGAGGGLGEPLKGYHLG